MIKRGEHDTAVIGKKGKTNKLVTDSFPRIYSGSVTPHDPHQARKQVSIEQQAAKAEALKKEGKFNPVTGRKILTLKKKQDLIKS